MSSLAKFIADVATGRAKLPKTGEVKDPAAVALGRKGGLKGGKARAGALTAKGRAENAKKVSLGEKAGACKILDTRWCKYAAEWNRVTTPNRRAE